MTSDASTETSSFNFKSNGSMKGGIRIDGVSAHDFDADHVGYVNNDSVVQVIGLHGTPDKGRILAVKLEPGTPSGNFKFGDKEINMLSYSPPHPEPLWTVIGGEVEIIHDGSRAHGSLQIYAKEKERNLDAFVRFDISN